jgi:16S rRNA (guanine966-N2)-methyltransferase
VFNWLAPVIVGSRCLDLFAGTGVLGFEAASRGAEEVILIERDPYLIRRLDQQAARLEAREIAIVKAEALEWLKGPANAFDIVFLDPPFGQGLLGPCCEQLEARGWLTPGAWIYLETEAALRSLPIPPHWRIERAKQAGQVRYYLARSP